MSNYKSTMIREDILNILMKVARLRGISLQELLEELIENSIDEYELSEVL